MAKQTTRISLSNGRAAVRSRIH